MFISSQNGEVEFSVVNVHAYIIITGLYVYRGRTDFLPSTELNVF